MAYRELELTLLSARDLKNVNLLMRMDVYAVASISGDPMTQQRTPTDMSGGRNPCWNTTLRFNVPPSAAATNGGGWLHVLIRSERALGDRDVGEVIVPLAELLASANGPGQQPTRLASYQVHTVHRGDPRGVLNVSYRLGPIVSPAAVGYPMVPQQTLNSRNPTTAQPPYQNGPRHEEAPSLVNGKSNEHKPPQVHIDTHITQIFGHGGGGARSNTIPTAKEDGPQKPKKPYAPPQPNETIPAKENGSKPKPFYTPPQPNPSSGKANYYDLNGPNASPRKPDRLQQETKGGEQTNAAPKIGPGKTERSARAQETLHQKDYNNISSSRKINDTQVESTQSNMPDRAESTRPNDKSNGHRPAQVYVGTQLITQIFGGGGGARSNTIPIAKEDGPERPEQYSVPAHPKETIPAKEHGPKPKPLYTPPQPNPSSGKTNYYDSNMPNASPRKPDRPQHEIKVDEQAQTQPKIGLGKIDTKAQQALQQQDYNTISSSRKTNGTHVESTQSSMSGRADLTRPKEAYAPNRSNSTPPGKVVDHQSGAKATQQHERLPSLPIAATR